MTDFVSEVETLPAYLKDLIFDSGVSSHLNGESYPPTATVLVLGLNEINELASRDSQYARLLLRRHAVTHQIATAPGPGLYPPLILQRAHVYVALGYADLAAADAYVSYTLCQTRRSEDWISDLTASYLNGSPWPGENDENALVSSCLVASLRVLCTCLTALGATKDANDKRLELLDCLNEAAIENVADDGGDELAAALRSPFCDFGATRPQDSDRLSESSVGLSRREIYPWNYTEPDRNSSAALEEINGMLTDVACGVEVRVTALPALDDNGAQDSGGGDDGTWHQLGLFAKDDLPPGTRILREKSILTAIRPLDDALCDACGADLESVPREELNECSGDDCDITFCSQECALRAAKGYHRPAVEDNGSESTDSFDEQRDDGYHEQRDSVAAFCGNTTLHEIGRTSSTTTPEWDLYFLLLTRTVQMSVTQSIPPLELLEIKYLWGDFNSTLRPGLQTISPVARYPRTLPFTLYHNIALPLQFFEELMSCTPSLRPYSPTWLANFDWWHLQTLLAKFRGVANAQQSTYDGKAEIAAVHPMWCLANHSCEPNVRWTPTGAREFIVRDRDPAHQSLDHEHRQQGTETKTGKNDERHHLVEDDDQHLTPSLAPTTASALAPAPSSRVGEKQSETETDTKATPEWKGIPKDQEIWSHYTDIRLPVSERRERLKQVLGGICRCRRCMIESGEKR